MTTTEDRTERSSVNSAEDNVVSNERPEVYIPDDIVSNERPEVYKPDDIVSSILLQLPLASLFRCRTLCKGWKTMIASQWFLSKRLELRAGVRECMLFVVGRLFDTRDFTSYTRDITSCFYNPTSDCWYKLPPCTNSLHMYGLPRLEDRPPNNLELPWVSASGGVLAILSNLHREEMYIGNPVLSSWAQVVLHIPNTNHKMRIRDVMGVFMDATARSFKLVAIIRPNTSIGAVRIGQFDTFVFNSTRGGWSLTTSVFPMNQSIDRWSDYGVFVSTVLYCMASVVPNLLAYDLERARWNWLAVPAPRDRRIYSLNLVNVRDRLLCLALCGNYNSARHNCLEIWEMDFERNTWTVLDSMPAPIFSCFFWAWISTGQERRVTVNHLRRLFANCRFKVVVGQDLEVYIMHNTVDKIVAVNLEHTPAAWRWLPPYPYGQFAGTSLHRVDPWLEFGSWPQQ